MSAKRRCLASNAVAFTESAKKLGHAALTTMTTIASRLRVKNGLMIPLAVQHARHKTALFVRLVIDDIALHGKTAKTRGDLIACPACVSVRDQQVKSPRDRFDEPIGARDAAVLGNVQPDLFQIAFGERRKAIPFHLDVRRFGALVSAKRFRPRAFTRDASFDAERAVYSTNSPRSI